MPLGRISSASFPFRCSVQIVLGALLILSPGQSTSQNASIASTPTPTILGAKDTPSVLPDAVFFSGRSSDVQMRNSGGVRFSDGMFVLSALIDNGGYSSGLEQKYQGYFITEVPLRFGDRQLQPGAYGVGFLQNNQFVVMDLGGHDLFTINGGHDAELKRAIPFQILPGSSGGKFRLYFGREYVDFIRAADR